MRWVRAVLRLLSIGLVTAAVCFFWALAAAAGFWSPRWRQQVRHMVFQTWSRLVLKVMNARVSVDGAPPSRPFFLVANHLSYLDIPVLASRLPGVFVAKKEIRSWPVIGFLCYCMGTIFIDRTSRRDIPRVLERLDREMSFGEGVMIFPEGTSSAGRSVLPFRPPLLEAAAASDVPVSCCALRYSTAPGEPAAGDAVCWWGGMTFSDHLFKLLMLPGFTAEIVFGSKTIVEKDRKRLADRSWREVDRLFVPIGTDRQEGG